MSEYNPKRERKRKREIELEDIYRMLELIYHRLGESGYRSKLGRPGLGYRGGISKPNLKLNQKMNPKLYERSQSYAKPELKYNPKPEKSSFGGGKPWSEPEIYRPRERLVYDPEVKGLLQKIEKHLAKVLSERPERDTEQRDLDKLDMEELTKVLEKSEDPKVLEKLSERELAEINKAEPEPKLYGLDSIEKSAKPEAGPEQEKLSKEPSELEEKAAEEQGMFIAGLFEMDEAEFNRLVEELKRRRTISGEEWEKTKGGSESEVSGQEGAEALPAEEGQSTSEPLAGEAGNVKHEVQLGVVEEAELGVEPEIEPIEPMESELFDVKPEVLPEDLDDPVFWQRLEEEMIEGDLKKPEAKPEAEPE